MLITFLKSAIRLSATFLFGSTGEIIIEKGGHLNLGIPGVMSVGAAAGCLMEYVLVSSNVNSPALFVLLPLLITILAGALMGLLYSFLTVTLRANQNVVGLAMTTFGVGLAGYLVNSESKLYLIARASTAFTNLFNVPQNANGFVQIFFSHGILVFLAIIIAVVVQIILSKTRVGLNLRAVGENPATADAAGINVTKYKYVSTCVGCAISAIGGLFCIMDYMGGNWEYILEGFGWLSLALVIFTMWRPSLAILGSIIFAGLYTFSNFAGIAAYQKDFVNILPYAVTIVILILTSIFDKKKKVQPPAALGVSYFREER